MALSTDGFRTAQAAGSKTFSAPPLDGSLALHQLYDYHGTHSPDHPLYVFAEESGRLKTISWSKAQRGIHRSQLFATEKLADSLENSHHEPLTVAILANSDTITFQLFLIGLLRTGVRPFPISIRNSAIGVANLIQQSGASHVFVTPDEAMQGVIKAALKEMKSVTPKQAATSRRSVEDNQQPDHASIPVLPMPNFDVIFPITDDTEEFHLLPATNKPDLDTPALILHSSGSTAFPKLRTLTHKILLQMARTPWFGERDLHGETMAVHTLPLFHVSGFFHTCWAPSTGMTLSLFRPSQPPIGITPASQLASCIATGVTILFGIPHFMEEWSLQSESIDALKKFNGIVFGGAPLSKAVGDLLESKGVPLWHIYGATEMGIVASCMPKASLQFGWEYFFFSPHVEPILVPQNETTDSKEHVMELLLKPCSTHTPTDTNISLGEGLGSAYATSDLLIAHPQVPGLYKILGRADDQIMLSSGEKTNPSPIEHIITRSPLVINALMFGRGRFQNGVIIEPKTPFNAKEDGGQLLEQFRNEIWPYVERANAFAPTHSRIFKEMIIVTDPSKPFEYTPKGNPRRHVSVALYDDEINNLYASVAAQGSSGPPPPAVWNESSVMEYVRTLVGQVLKNTVEDEDDLFEFGCDSLQATQIMNSILYSFREAKVPTSEVGPNFVFEYPTINALGTEILRLAVL